MTEKKTQKERLLESLALKRTAEKAHEITCKQILAEIEAGTKDGSLDGDTTEIMILGMELENGVEGSPFIQFPIEITHLDGSKADDLWDKGWHHEPNTLVAIRPSAPAYEGKTFLGVYIGNLALSATMEYHRESGVLAYRPSFHNPAIYVPDLNKLIFGCESWWGRIKSEASLKAITDADINNVWYVKALQQLRGEETPEA